MKTLTVLISGKQGSGKNALATELRKILGEREICMMEHSFAKVLYRMHDEVLDILSSYRAVPEKDGTLLQLLGTEWGRKTYGDNIWVDIVKQGIEQGNRIWDSPMNKSSGVHVITDCRFVNEVVNFPQALKVRLECSETIRKARILTTPGQNWRENSNHPSECDLDKYEGWHRIIDTETHDQVFAAQLVAADIMNRMEVK
jgi:hypothetical protein